MHDRAALVIGGGQREFVIELGTLLVEFGVGDRHIREPVFLRELRERFQQCLTVFRRKAVPHHVKAAVADDRILKKLLDKRHMRGFVFGDPAECFAELFLGLGIDGNIAAAVADADIIAVFIAVECE